MSSTYESRADVLAELLKDVEISPQPRAAVEEEIINLGDDFDFDGFQVVRREFFAHLREPSAIFNNCKFYVNSACLLRFPETTSVQILINQTSKIMAIMPCEDGAKDSFIWCSSGDKRKPKQISCRLFFAKVASLMNWNPDYRYKMLGRLIQANGETLLAFDLSAAEIYRKTAVEGQKPKASRTPVFPAEWQNQFGLSYNEHRQSMQIDIFEGYAVYSIKDSPADDAENSAAGTGSAVG